MASTELELAKNKMTENNQYDLIRGEFTPDEALEIINYLIDKKISFHHLKTFGKEIRFGEVDQKSVERCEELKETKEELNKFIDQVKAQGKTLRIHSSLSFEII